METDEVTETTNEGIEIKDPKAVLDALERAKADAKKYREKAEALESEKENLNKRISDLEGEEGLASYKRKIIEMTAKQQLQSKGIKDVDRIFGLLDAESLGLDDKNELTGLDESVTNLKVKLPELFNEKKRVGGGADAFATGDVKHEMSTTERQVERLRATR